VNGAPSDDHMGTFKSGGWGGIKSFDDWAKI
jgi:hypothetical protein